MNSTQIDTPDCCAVLLRGGKSRRMGRDKALMRWGDKTFIQTIASEMDFLEEKYLSVAAEEAADNAVDIAATDAADIQESPPSAKAADFHESPRAAAEAADNAADIAAAEALQKKSLDVENGKASGRIAENDGLSSDWIRMPDLIADRGPLGGIYTALSTCRAGWALIASCDIPAVEQRFFTMLLENRTDDVDIVYPRTPDGRMHMTCALYRKSIAPIILQQIEKGDNRLRVLTELCRAKELLIDEPDLMRMISNINTDEEFSKTAAWMGHS